MYHQHIFCRQFACSSYRRRPHASSSVSPRGIGEETPHAFIKGLRMPSLYRTRPHRFMRTYLGGRGHSTNPMTTKISDISRVVAGERMLTGCRENRFPGGRNLGAASFYPANFTPRGSEGAVDLWIRILSLTKTSRRGFVRLRKVYRVYIL